MMKIFRYILIKDVEGTYSGQMQTTSIAPLENAENEAEDGVTVNAELKDNHILISKFPVEDLSKALSKTRMQPKPSSKR